MCPSTLQAASVVRVAAKRGCCYHLTLSPALSRIHKDGQSEARQETAVSQVRSDLQPAERNLCCVYSELDCSRLFPSSSERQHLRAVLQLSWHLSRAHDRTTFLSDREKEFPGNKFHPKKPPFSPAFGECVVTSHQFSMQVSLGI